MRLHSSLRGTAALAALLPLGLASAQGLASVGPINPNHGFPDSYTDIPGQSLDLCLTDPTLCLLEGGAVSLANPALPFPDNYGGTFPDEAFWWACEALMPSNNGGKALLVLAIEAAFANELPAAGDQISFARVRIRVDNLVDGASYTVTTPVGVFNFVAAGSGARGINFTDDVGIVPGVFTGALGGAIGPFLTWDSDLPVLDAQGREYIGNPTIDHTITGSPFGTNFFRIQGPNVGGAGVNTIETDLFGLLGLKSQAAPPPPAAPVANFASAPNSGTAPLLVSFTDLSTGDITSRMWSFGDGGTSTAQNPTHTYAAGTFTVSLEVTGPGGSDVETKVNVIAVGEPPPAGALVLANPVPGMAGVPNSLVVTGATPGRVVGVYAGQTLGATVVNVGNCGGLPVGLSRPFRLIGKATANASGVATIVVTPPNGSAGKTFHFQAAEPSTCRTSNIVSDVL